MHTMQTVIIEGVYRYGREQAGDEARTSQSVSAHHVTKHTSVLQDQWLSRIYTAVKKLTLLPLLPPWM